LHYNMSFKINYLPLFSRFVQSELTAAMQYRSLLSQILLTNAYATFVYPDNERQAWSTADSEQKYKDIFTFQHNSKLNVASRFIFSELWSLN
jgi:hypothetical protein